MDRAYLIRAIRDLEERTGRGSCDLSDYDLFDLEQYEQFLVYEYMNGAGVRS